MARTSLHIKILIPVAAALVLALGAAYLFVVRNMSDPAARLAGGAPGFLFMAAFVVLIAGGTLAIAIQWLVVRPLRRLQQRVEAVGRGDFAVRFRPEADDELGDVAAAVHGLTEQIWESQSGFDAVVRSKTAELREHVQLMQGILSSMSCGVVLLDLEGTVRLINIQGARMLFRDPDSVIGRRLQELVPETGVFMNTEPGSYRELELVTPDKTLFPIGFNASHYIGPDGDRSGVIVVYQDLTKLKALQSKVLDKERFSAMGRVIAGVAHEIKNPLFGISSVAQIFERELINPIHRELAQALLSEARRLNRLVEELLVYGRPMKLLFERCDLSRLLEEVFELNRMEIQEKKIIVRDDHLVPKINAYVDPGQIRQVFLNLLRNALESSPQGGALTVKLLLEDRFIIFTLADQGKGIPAQSIDRVFDLFFTTKTGGTGLGLAICKKIVQDHGGEITIESEEGSGEMATVKLPYRSVA